jgi:hypothetical protein
MKFTLVVLIVICATLGFPVFVLKAQEAAAPIRGTLITAMGNKKGVVVMTDSRATINGKPDPDRPIQKLFKYDEHLVYAAAGLWYLPVSTTTKPATDPLPDFDLQAFGIVKAYRDAVKKNGKTQTIAETMQGISAAIRWRFNVQAELNAYLGQDAKTILEAYRIQIILAGLDTDGELKLGRVDISIRPGIWADGQRHWVAVELVPPDCGLRTIRDELFICSAGIDTTEIEMRSHPEHFEKLPIMRDFAQALAEDNGASFSIEDMKKLGNMFKSQTADERVGGNDQIATIRRGGEVQVEGLDHFRESDIKNTPPFLVFLCQPGAIIMAMDSFGMNGGLPVIYESCTFVNSPLLYIDGNAFLHCVFRDSTIWYMGGDNTLFEDENRIEGNSRLRLSPYSCNHPDLTRRLMKRFDFEHGGSMFQGIESPPCSH